MGEFYNSLQIIICMYYVLLDKSVLKAKIFRVVEYVKKSYSFDDASDMASTVGLRTENLSSNKTAELENSDDSAAYLYIIAVTMLATCLVTAFVLPTLTGKSNNCEESFVSEEGSSFATTNEPSPRFSVTCFSHEPITEEQPSDSTNNQEQVAELAGTPEN